MLRTPSPHSRDGRPESPAGRRDAPEAQVSELGREQHLVAAFFNRTGDQLLVDAVPVSIRGYDQIDSKFDGTLNRRDRLRVIGSP